MTRYVIFDINIHIVTTPCGRLDHCSLEEQIRVQQYGGNEHWTNIQACLPAELARSLPQLQQPHYLLWDINLDLAFEISDYPDCHM